MITQSVFMRIKTLVNRYGTDHNDMHLSLMEELGEYARAKRQETSGHKKEAQEPSKIELLDLMLVATEAYIEAGGTFEEMEPTALMKLDKWAAKLSERQGR